MFFSLGISFRGREVKRLTVVGDDLLSILVLCGFIADQHKVPVVAVGAAQVVHQVRPAFEASVPLRSKSQPQ